MQGRDKQTASVATKSLSRLSRYHSGDNTPYKESTKSNKKNTNPYQPLPASSPACVAGCACAKKCYKNLKKEVDGTGTGLFAHTAPTH